MSTVMHRVMHLANRLGVVVYRRSGGRVGGRGAGGLPVLLLTVPGRRTGQPRTTPVGYFDYQGGHLDETISFPRGIPPCWCNPAGSARHAGQAGSGVSSASGMVRPDFLS